MAVAQEELRQLWLYSGEICHQYHMCDSCALQLFGNSAAWGRLPWPHCSRSEEAHRPPQTPCHAGLVQVDITRNLPPMLHTPVPSNPPNARRYEPVAGQPRKRKAAQNSTPKLASKLVPIFSFGAFKHKASTPKKTEAETCFSQRMPLHNTF